MSQGTLSWIYLIHPKVKRWIQLFIHMAVRDLKRLNSAFQLPFGEGKFRNLEKKEEYWPWAGARQNHAVYGSTEHRPLASASSARAAGWGCARSRSHTATGGQHGDIANTLKTWVHFRLGQMSPTGRVISRWPGEDLIPGPVSAVLCREGMVKGFF